jgi:hypothetical protein
LKCIKINKQADDLRSALEARLLRVGLKKKHATVSPENENVIGRHTRLDWGPANLVTRSRGYPDPQPLVVKPHCPPLEEENEIKLCLTDSIRGFLAWKKQSKKNSIVPKNQESISQF